jgi:hypothetical protein
MAVVGEGEGEGWGHRGHALRLAVSSRCEGSDVCGWTYSLETQITTAAATILRRCVELDRGQCSWYKSSVRPPTVLRPPFLFMLGLLGLSAGHGSALARGHCRVWPSGYGRVVEKEMSFVLLDWKSTHAIRSCSNETWAFGSYAIGHN